MLIDTEMAAQMTVESGHSSSNEDTSEQATVEDKDEKSNMLGMFCCISHR